MQLDFFSLFQIYLLLTSNSSQNTLESRPPIRHDHSADMSTRRGAEEYSGTPSNHALDLS